MTQEQPPETATADEQPAEPEPAPLRRPPPSDPSEYDSERNAAARARGLAAPYIAGGRDPDPEEGLREERHYLRLLLIMVIAIVAAGFVIGIGIQLFLTATGGG
jgi:hypothetical protein